MRKAPCSSLFMPLALFSLALILTATPAVATPPSQVCPDGGAVTGPPKATTAEQLAGIVADTTLLCTTATANVAALHHARVVVVDSLGGGDYATISSATAFVASQNPSSASPWTIVLMPGTPSPSANYSETSFTIPKNTTIQGYTNGSALASNQPAIFVNCVSGTCITMQSGSALVNVFIFYFAAPTAAVKVVEVNATSGTNAQLIQNVQITSQPTNSTFTVDALTNTIGFLYLYGVYVSESGGNVGNRAIVNTDTGSGHGISGYTIRVGGNNGCTKLVENAAASGGAIQLFSSRLDTKCTTDLTNGGGGIIVTGTPYASSSGTITNNTDFSAYGPTTPATCSPGQNFINTATPARCSCVTANTWSCTPEFLSCYVAADITNATATLATTGCSVPVVLAHKYQFECVLYLVDSTAVDGIDVDLGGGTATATNLRAHFNDYDGGAGLQTQATTLTTLVSDATFTGDGSVEVKGSLEPSASGTIIPRFAQAAHTVGTATLYRGSHCRFWGQ